VKRERVRPTTTRFHTSCLSNLYLVPTFSTVPTFPSPLSMTDDTRSIAPRRRNHRPILVVANPSPDSDSDSTNEPAMHRAYYHHPYSNNGPPSSTPPSPSIDKTFPVQFSSSREPGPLTTANLPSHSRPHPASQSNPALSSPSGTSSPPPSTPGQSLPPTDVPDPTSRPFFSVGPSNSSDALVQQQHTPIHASSAGHLFGKIKAHIPRIHNDRRLSGSSRPTSVCRSFAPAIATELTNSSSLQLLPPRLSRIVIGL